MNESEGADRPQPPLLNYWRLWIFDAVLVSCSVLFFLATQFGTIEFFGVASLMALLPLIPVMVLVGGAGSTVFALTKVKLIEKYSLKRPAAVALLVAPAFMVMLLLGILGVNRSAARQLAYICQGNTPTSASQIKITGYSAFLRGEWLAVFHADQKDFQEMVTESKLVPVDEFEFRKMLEGAAIKKTRLFQNLPPLNNAYFYRRNFTASEDHQLGGLYAVFDPATSTAVVIREHHD